MIEGLANREAVVAKTIWLRGMVQGRGVRPAVARIATDLGIAGFVRNADRGVEIQCHGSERKLDAFADRLRERFPASLELRPISESDLLSSSQFEIRSSVGNERLRTDVPVDLKTCDTCLSEYLDPNNRRYLYPFITCTDCGPRYSILRRMPFDRANTTMDRFPMCDACHAEYSEISNRRFHAQTISCCRCGPTCWATDQAGRVLAEGDSAIRLISERLVRGEIAAIKGVGGYQLICDATSPVATQKLRLRKQRKSRPLAVMIADPSTIHNELSDREIESLSNLTNAIVIVDYPRALPLADEVAPLMRSVGLMMPTTPIHLRLATLCDRPLVVTSGNVSGSALCYKNQNALTELVDVADVFLQTDRPIVRPLDDSVVQVAGGKVMTIRAARGIAPLPWSFAKSSFAMAVGGEQKNTTAIGRPDEAVVLMPHVGDLNHESNRYRFSELIRHTESLYRIRPAMIARDIHPDYFSTRWAEQLSIPTQSVQHHHAHVAASMLEHKLLDQTVLGLSFDGSGYGKDATVWGGEALLATSSSFVRVAHLRPFRLPGGEAAIRQPWRTAFSLISQMQGNSHFKLFRKALAEPTSRQLLRFLLHNGPVTSSMGRLFDAVAFLVLGVHEVDFEGEAAMRLEAACDLGEMDSYQFLITEGDPMQIDWRPVFRAILADCGQVDAGRIAMRFHRAIANLVVELAGRFLSLPCVVTGGVFQNRTLLNLIAHTNQTADVRYPGRIPVNDGGLAVGQLVVSLSSSQENN